MTDPVQDAATRLSTPRLRKAPPRPLRRVELTSLRSIADSLINAYEDLPAGGRVENFDDAAHDAVAIMTRYFPQLERVLADHAGQSDTASWLTALHRRDAESFWVVSSVVTAVYVTSPSVLAILDYRLPHRNPAGLDDAVDDLADGLLDPVLERGSTYVKPAQS